MHTHQCTGLLRRLLVFLLLLVAMAWVAAWGTAITINGLEQPVNLLIVRADCRNHYFLNEICELENNNQTAPLSLSSFSSQSSTRVRNWTKSWPSLRGDMWPMNSQTPHWPCPEVTQGAAAPQTPSAPQNPACEFGSFLLPLTRICHPFVLLWATSWCHVFWTHCVDRCWDKTYFASNHLPHKHSTHHTIYCWGSCLSTRAQC